MGAEPVEVVAGGDQQLGADDGPDALDGQQGRVGGGRSGQHPCFEVGDFLSEVAVPSCQRPQRVHGVSQGRVGLLLGTRTSQGGHEFGVQQVAVPVA